jgi:hypothetical protein
MRVKRGLGRPAERRRLATREDARKDVGRELGLRGERNACKEKEGE